MTTVVVEEQRNTVTISGDVVTVASVGIAGPAGADGADGAQGPQGTQGIQGEQGIQGIQGIGSIGVPVCPYIVGEYYDSALTSSPNPTTVGAIGRLEVYRHFAAASLRVDRMGVGVGTPVAGSFVRCMVYASGTDGWPAALVLQSPDIDTSVGGHREATVDFTFAAGTVYWLGTWQSAATSLRALPVVSIPPLRIHSTGDITYSTAVRQAFSFAGSPPNPWGFATSQLQPNHAPAVVRMRAAAL
jgi:hypothetical protein